jgi:signal peptidase I
VLWCAAALTLLVTTPGAIWLRAWGPMGVQVLQEASAMMVPTVWPGDIVLTIWYTVQDPDPRSGDVVIFPHGGLFYMGRVVGMPGDIVQLVDGQLAVNGVPVLRERLEDYSVGKDGKPTRVPFYKVPLLEGGSYRIIEADGDEGSDDRTDPVQVPDGEVFVLSDNRDYPFDSRNDEVGTIPIRDIRGYPVMILWSGDRGRIGSVLH